MSIVALGTALAPYAGELLLGGGAVSLFTGVLICHLGQDMADDTEGRNFCVKIAQKIAGYAIAIIGGALGIASMLAMGAGIFVFGATIDSLIAAITAVVTPIIGAIFVVLYCQRAL